MSDAARPPADRSKMLIEAGLALAAEIDLDAVLQRIVDLAIAITDARYGALGVLGSDGAIDRFITSGISVEQRERIGHPPVGRGVLGLLIEELKPVRIDDLVEDERAVGFPEHHPEMHTFLGAPVLARGHVFGNIYLTEKSGSVPFTAEDEEAIQILAAQAGVAVENARLYEEMAEAQKELRRLEVMDERERIAKELHDGVIQALFAVGMSLQGAAALAGNDDLRAQLENSVEDVDRTIRDLRNYIFGLRPGILADRQLDQALRDLGAQFAERSGIVTVVDVEESAGVQISPVRPPLPPPDVVQLTREALSNVGRHSGAATCRVSLRRADAGVVLEIDDDGSGFDVQGPWTGMGLENLRTRVASIGGSFELSSSPREGTTVRARFPI